MVSSTPRPHFTPGKDPVPILQEAGWASGPVWTCGKSRPHRDSIPDCPARSQSLYRLSYPAHNVCCRCTLYYVKVHLADVAVLCLRKAWCGCSYRTHLLLHLGKLALTLRCVILRIETYRVSVTLLALWVLVRIPLYYTNLIRGLQLKCDGTRVMHWRGSEGETGEWSG